MLSGKAVAKAFRRHRLLHTALNAMITSETFKLLLKEADMADDDQPNASEPTSYDDTIADKGITEATNLYDQLMECNISLNSLCTRKYSASSKRGFLPRSRHC